MEGEITVSGWERAAYQIGCASDPHIRHAMFFATKGFVWWTGGNGEKFLEGKGWRKKVYLPEGTEGSVHFKEKEGFGIWDFEAFNFALLAKQGWRLLRNPNLLVERVLKTKYDPHEDFMKVKIHTGHYLYGDVLEKARELLA